MQVLRGPSLSSMVPIGSGMLPNSSMEALFRVMRPVAEQRLAEKLRAQDEVHPALIASDVIDEFRKILQFEPHAEALRARILAHIEKVIQNYSRRRVPSSDD